MMIERRHNRKFIETLSIFLVIVSVAGAFLVLIDPVATFTVGTASIHVGGTGFGDQLKGAVIQTILFGGFTGAVGYWLGASNQPQPGIPPEETK